MAPTEGLLKNTQARRPSLARLARSGDHATTKATPAERNRYETSLAYRAAGIAQAERRAVRFAVHADVSHVERRPPAGRQTVGKPARSGQPAAHRPRSAPPRCRSH